MKMIAAVLVGSVALGLLFISGQTVRAQVSPYTFHQINVGFSPAMDVNDDGTVVGYWDGPPVSADPNSNSLGYVWTLATGAQPIITDPAIVRKFPFYAGINDPAQALRIAGDTIAGVGCPDNCGTNGNGAAAWNRAAHSLTFMGSFDDPSVGSVAAGVNETGQGVGTSSGGGYNNFGPFVWSSGTGLQKLTGFSGVNGSAHGISSAGLVVGSKGTGTRNVAFLWSSSTGETAIPDLPGTASSDGFAVNDSAVVIGRYLLTDGTYHVFRWSAATGTEDLSAPTGFPELMDINNDGDIVLTVTQNGRRVPYLYQSGAWTNLNDLMPTGTGFTLQFAEAINNNGWIVGAGTTDPFGAEFGQGFLVIPPTSCAADISTTTSVMQGPQKFTRSTGRYAQTITLKNGDGAAAGPVSLVLDNLSSNSTLVNATGVTSCTTPTASPYINVDVGTDGSFTPRERVRVTLEFTQPATYTVRVLAGAGNR
jgi:hypothetical protein